MKKRGREEKYFAFSQIFLLIISMFAFSFIIYQTQFISAGSDESGSIMPINFPLCERK